MKIKNILLTALVAFQLNNLFAHAIWIETSSTGKSGKVQEAKIFFGEYSANEKDPANDWFSNLENFKLWLTAPDGKKTELTAVASGDHFKATFTPATSGVYLLSIDHLVEEVYHTSKIHYYAVAAVTVNESFEGKTNIPAATDLAVQATLGVPYKMNTAVDVDIFYKKALFAKGKLTVQPPVGWTKDFDVSEKGHASFTPFIDGRYMLEGTYVEETTGADYKSIWHCVTYCIEVAK